MTNSTTKPTQSIIINLDDWHQECQLCLRWQNLKWCVPYYEEPRADLEIGDEMPNGDRVGGMSCCERCFYIAYGMAATK